MSKSEALTVNAITMDENGIQEEGWSICPIELPEKMSGKEINTILTKEESDLIGKLLGENLRKSLESILKNRLGQNHENAEVIDGTAILETIANIQFNGPGGPGYTGHTLKGAIGVYPDKKNKKEYFSLNIETKFYSYDFQERSTREIVDRYNAIVSSLTTDSTESVKWDTLMVQSDILMLIDEEERGFSEIAVAKIEDKLDNLEMKISCKNNTDCEISQLN